MTHHQATIARLYDTSTAAQTAVRELENAGFAHDSITYLANGSGNAAGANDTAVSAPSATTGRDGMTGADTGAATGATLGTLVGGGAGLLAGLGALAIPGVGPIIAAGWLVAAITGAGVGAAAGGLVGALAQSGLGEEHAQTYAEGVRRGGHLVMVRAGHDRSAEAEEILDRHGAVDLNERRAAWQSDGWAGGGGLVAEDGVANTGGTANDTVRTGRGSAA
ncbi:MAG TPA: hypothetical protein VE033_10895 [Acetobacteraceae bacterium]|jgi:hypothetical protein|nr:hypothetical protein [Acetobacteraceae bacterium]